MSPPPPAPLTSPCAPHAATAPYTTEAPRSELAKALLRMATRIDDRIPHTPRATGAESRRRSRGGHCQRGTAAPGGAAPRVRLAASGRGARPRRSSRERSPREPYNYTSTDQCNARQSRFPGQSNTRTRGERRLQLLPIVGLCVDDGSVELRDRLRGGAGYCAGLSEEWGRFGEAVGGPHITAS